jgi:flagellar biosynthesis protein FlhF
MSAHDESSDETSRDDAAPQSMRYRLVVGSASEAVALVRERFGEAARVISVRQLEAGGLRRFLQKPRLEVIVEVGIPADEQITGETGDSPSTAQPESSAAEPPAERSSAVAPAPERTPSMLSASAASTAGSAQPEAPRREWSVLRVTGLDESLLARVRAEHRETDWEALPLPQALGLLGAWLRRNYDAIPRRPVGKRRVFFGSCGVGKTTALCKALAIDVFVRGKPVAVLKLDGDQPNASDGLAAFCDVLGAPLLRSAAEVSEFDDDTLLYVDVPGIGHEARAEQTRLAQTLDALDVDTRVLVVNAATESEVIQDAWELGRACGATHVVFTHADEVRRPAKLWRFVLQGGLRPLFLSAGPSPAGEIEEDVFGALLARTFPPAVARAAVATSRRVER